MPLSRRKGSIEESNFAASIFALKNALPVQEVLISGGDSRLRPDADKRNSYGCTAFPQSAVLDFGSSTASSISASAFAHVNESLARMTMQMTTVGIPRAFENGIERIRQKLSDLLGISNAEIVLAPSGTDAQLQMVFLATMLLGRPFTTVVAGSDQTGSGTAHTARGNHFSDRTSLGTEVLKGEPISDIFKTVRTIDVPFCDSEGRLRSTEEMDGAVYAAVAAAIGRGEKVLLQAMDSSKLGWRAPSVSCLAHITAAWPDQVCIVVDACQLRVGRARLKDYLARGFFVLITGSKFFTGPAFSGALFVPRSWVRQVAAIRVPPNALAGYSTCYDWPTQLPDLRNGFPAIPNYGAWLRWEAALSEMEGYFAVPSQFREDFFAKLAGELRTVLDASSNLVPINSPGASGDAVFDAEMRHHTIFPFVPRHEGQPLSPSQCGSLYRAMRQDLSKDAPGLLKRVAASVSEIGQPVVLRHVPSAALRICTSARHVRCHWEDGRSVSDAVSAVVEDARSVVAKLDWLISNPQLREGA